MSYHKISFDKVYLFPEWLGSDIAACRRLDEIQKMFAP